MSINTIDTPEATITVETRPTGDGNGTARITTVIAKPGTAAANRDGMANGLEQGLDDLRAYIAVTTPTQAQTMAVVKLLCRAVIRLVRLQIGKLDSTD